MNACLYADALRYLIGKFKFEVEKQLYCCMQKKISTVCRYTKYLRPTSTDIWKERQPNHQGTTVTVKLVKHHCLFRTLTAADELGDLQAVQQHACLGVRTSTLHSVLYLTNISTRCTAVFTGVEVKNVFYI